MNQNNITEQLFQTIDTIVAKRLEEVILDETIQCTVLRKISKDSNEYEVKNNSIIYKAIAKDGEEYSENDNVCVSFLKNSDEKIILGKYTLSQENALEYKDPFGSFVINKTMLLIHSDETDKQPTITLSTTADALSSKSIDLIPVGNQSSSLSGYDFMGLEFGITVSNLPSQTAGNWAIGVQLLDKNNNPLHEMYENNTMTPYLLSSDEVYGNPYTLTANFTQRKLFHFPHSLQLSKIRQIKLTLYQSGNFADVGELLVENFQISFGYDVNKYLDKAVHLYVEGEYNRAYAYSDNLTVNGLAKPDIKALLIDQVNKKVLNTLPEGQSLRWYQYVINEPGDEYGGGYWKYIDNDGLTLPSNKYTLDIDRPNSQIKAVLCEDRPSINFNVDASITVIFDDRRKEGIFDEDSDFLTDADKNQVIIFQDLDNDNNKVTRAVYWENGGWVWEDSWNWPTNENWLAIHYPEDTPLGTIAAVINLQENTNLRPQAPIDYYQYIGTKKWVYLNIDETEKTIIETSDPFIFTNQKTEIINGEGIIQIVAKTVDETNNNQQSKTYFLQYDLGKLVNKKPILLTVRPTSGTWPNSEIPKTITWKMISDGLIRGLSLVEEESNQKELVISRDEAGNINLSCYCYLKEDYNTSKSAGLDNVIECLVNDQYQAFIELSFGELSTQGTNYSFKIEPIITEENLHNYLRNEVGATQSFKAILTTSDGIELDASNYELDWDWEQSSSYYEDTNRELSVYALDENGNLISPSPQLLEQCQSKPYIGIMPQEEGNQKLLQVNKTFSKDTTWQDQELEQSFLEYEGKKYLSTHKVTGQSSVYNIHILKATCKVNALYKNGDNSETRTVTLKALYPIGILNIDQYPSQLKTTGHFVLNGNSDNTLITNLSIPYAIGKLLPEEEYYRNVTWSLLPEGRTEPYSVDENDCLKSASNSFTSTSKPITIMGIWDNNFYQQPLMLQMVKYDVDLTNEWAGGVVTIDNTESTIMATAVGAGHKDTSTNLFTGVLMGEFSQGKNVLNGLYGFNQGVNTFGIDAETGNAFFKGHIEALSGTIGGWNIGPQSLYGQMSNTDETYHFGLTTPSNYTDTIFYVSSKKNEDVNERFAILANGTIQCTMLNCGNLSLSSEFQNNIKMSINDQEKWVWGVGLSYNVDKKETYGAGLYYSRYNGPNEWFQCGIKAEGNTDSTDAVFYIVDLGSLKDVKKYYFYVQEDGRVFANTYTAEKQTVFNDWNSTDKIRFDAEGIHFTYNHKGNITPTTLTKTWRQFFEIDET